MFTTCPSSTSHYADSETDSTSVTFALPTATDGIDVSCSHDSGSRFEIGETLVTCTAMDAAGNAAKPDCTFNVTVTGIDQHVSIFFINENIKDVLPVFFN